MPARRAATPTPSGKGFRGGSSPAVNRHARVSTPGPGGARGTTKYSGRNDHFHAQPPHATDRLGIPIPRQKDRLIAKLAGAASGSGAKPTSVIVDSHMNIVSPAPLMSSAMSGVYDTPRTALSATSPARLHSRNMEGDGLRVSPRQAPQQMTHGGSSPSHQTLPALGSAHRPATVSSIPLQTAKGVVVVKRMLLSEQDVAESELQARRVDQNDRGLDGSNHPDVSAIVSPSRDHRSGVNAAAAMQAHNLDLLSASDDLPIGVDLSSMPGASAPPLTPPAGSGQRAKAQSNHEKYSMHRPAPLLQRSATNPEPQGLPLQSKKASAESKTKGHSTSGGGADAKGTSIPLQEVGDHDGNNNNNDDDDGMYFRFRLGGQDVASVHSKDASKGVSLISQMVIRKQQRTRVDNITGRNRPVTASMDPVEDGKKQAQQGSMRDAANRPAGDPVDLFAPPAARTKVPGEKWAPGAGFSGTLAEEDGAEIKKGQSRSKIAKAKFVPSMNGVFAELLKEDANARRARSGYSLFEAAVGRAIDLRADPVLSKTDDESVPDSMRTLHHTTAGGRDHSKSPASTMRGGAAGQYSRKSDDKDEGVEHPPSIGSAGLATAHNATDFTWASLAAWVDQFTLTRTSAAVARDLESLISSVESGHGRGGTAAASASQAESSIGEHHQHHTPNTEAKSSGGTASPKAKLSVACAVLDRLMLLLTTSAPALENVVEWVRNEIYGAIFVHGKGSLSHDSGADKKHPPNPSSQCGHAPDHDTMLRSDLAEAHRAASRAQEEMVIPSSLDAIRSLVPPRNTPAGEFADLTQLILPTSTDFENYRIKTFREVISHLPQTHPAAVAAAAHRDREHSVVLPNDHQSIAGGGGRHRSSVGSRTGSGAVGGTRSPSRAVSPASGTRPPQHTTSTSAVHGLLSSPVSSDTTVKPEQQITKDGAGSSLGASRVTQSPAQSPSQQFIGQVSHAVGATPHTRTPQNQHVTPKSMQRHLSLLGRAGSGNLGLSHRGSPADSPLAGTMGSLHHGVGSGLRHGGAPFDATASFASLTGGGGVGGGEMSGTILDGFGGNYAYVFSHPQAAARASLRLYRAYAMTYAAALKRTTSRLVTRQSKSHHRQLVRACFSNWKLFTKTTVFAQATLEAEAAEQQKQAEVEALEMHVLLLEHGGKASHHGHNHAPHQGGTHAHHPLSSGTYGGGGSGGTSSRLPHSPSAASTALGESNSRGFTPGTRSELPSPGQTGRAGLGSPSSGHFGASGMNVAASGPVSLSGTLSGATGGLGETSSSYPTPLRTQVSTTSATGGAGGLPRRLSKISVLGGGPTPNASGAFVGGGGGGGASAHPSSVHSSSNVNAASASAQSTGVVRRPNIPPGLTAAEFLRFAHADDGEGLWETVPAKKKKSEGAANTQTDGQGHPGDSAGTDTADNSRMTRVGSDMSTGTSLPPVTGNSGAGHVSPRDNHDTSAAHDTSTALVASGAAATGSAPAVVGAGPRGGSGSRRRRFGSPLRKGGRSLLATRLEDLQEQLEDAKVEITGLQGERDVLNERLRQSQLLLEAAYAPTVGPGSHRSGGGAIQRSLSVCSAVSDATAATTTPRGAVSAGTSSPTVMQQSQRAGQPSAAGVVPPASLTSAVGQTSTTSPTAVSLSPSLPALGAVTSSSVLSPMGSPLASPNMGRLTPTAAKFAGGSNTPGMVAGGGAASTPVAKVKGRMSMTRADRDAENALRRGGQVTLSYLTQMRMQMHDAREALAGLKKLKFHPEILMRWSASDTVGEIAESWLSQYSSQFYPSSSAENESSSVFAASALVVKRGSVSAVTAASSRSGYGAGVAAGSAGAQVSMVAGGKSSVRRASALSGGQSGRRGSHRVSIVAGPKGGHRRGSQRDIGGDASTAGVGSGGSIMKSAEKRRGSQSMRAIGTTSVSGDNAASSVSISPRGASRSPRTPGTGGVSSRRANNKATASSSPEPEKEPVLVKDKQDPHMVDHVVDSGMTATRAAQYMDTTGRNVTVVDVSSHPERHVNDDDDDATNSFTAGGPSARSTLAPAPAIGASSTSAVGSTGAANARAGTAASSTLSPLMTGRSMTGGGAVSARGLATLGMSGRSTNGGDADRPPGTGVDFAIPESVILAYADALKARCPAVVTVAKHQSITLPSSVEIRAEKLAELLRENFNVAHVTGAFFMESADKEEHGSLVTSLIISTARARMRPMPDQADSAVWVAAEISYAELLETLLMKSVGAKAGVLEDDEFSDFDSDDLSEGDTDSEDGALPGAGAGSRGGSANTRKSTQNNNSAGSGDGGADKPTSAVSSAKPQASTSTAAPGAVIDAVAHDSPSGAKSTTSATTAVSDSDRATTVTEKPFVDTPLPGQPLMSNSSPMTDKPQHTAPPASAIVGSSAPSEKTHSRPNTSGSSHHQSGSQNHHAQHMHASGHPSTTANDALSGRSPYSVVARVETPLGHTPRSSRTPLAGSSTSASPRSRSKLLSLTETLAAHADSDHKAALQHAREKFNRARDETHDDHQHAGDDNGTSSTSHDGVSRDRNPSTRSSEKRRSEHTEERRRLADDDDEDAEDDGGGGASKPESGAVTPLWMQRRRSSTRGLEGLPSGGGGAPPHPTGSGQQSPLDAAWAANYAEGEKQHLPL